jgi:hypothetical protein
LLGLPQDAVRFLQAAGGFEDLGEAEAAVDDGVGGRWKGGEAASESLAGGLLGFGEATLLEEVVGLAVEDVGEVGMVAEVMTESSAAKS